MRAIGLKYRYLDSHLASIIFAFPAVLNAPPKQAKIAGGNL